MGIGSASVIEMIWTAIGVLPFLLGLAAIRFLWKEKIKLRNDGLNGADDIVILTWIGIVFFELVATFTIATVGVAAMLIPPNTAQPVTQTGIVVTLGLFVIGVMSAAVMIWVIFRRRILKTYLVRRYNVGHISELGQKANPAGMP